MATKTPEQESLLSKEEDERMELLPKIELASKHDFKLLRIALEDRIGILEKLAQKNKDEGYFKEAQQQEWDAARLKEVVPLLNAQAELALVTGDELRAGIENHLRTLVRRTVRLSNGPEDNPEKYLLEELSKRIELFGRAIAESAFYSGTTLRHMSTEEFGLKALGRLDG